MKFFKRPCNYFTNPVRVTMLNSILSALMLFLYEPFDFHLRNWGNALELAVFVFIVVSFSVLFFYVLPCWCNIYKRFGNWTIGKNILYLSIFLLSVGIGIFLFDFHVISGNNVLNYGSSYFYTLMYTDIIGTFSIGVIPLSFSYLLEKTLMLKMLVEQNGKYELHSKPVVHDNVTQNQNDCIVLKCDNNNSIDIHPNEIEFIEAAGNYVFIYSFNEQFQKTMVRAALAKFEEQLSDYSYLVRCHRAYIVNINNVAKCYRRKEGYRLRLLHTEEEIPISRTYLSKVKALLKI